MSYIDDNETRIVSYIVLSRKFIKLVFFSYYLTRSNIEFSIRETLDLNNMLTFSSKYLLLYFMYILIIPEKTLNSLTCV